MPALTHKTKQKNVLHATGLFCIDELVLLVDYINT